MKKRIVATVLILMLLMTLPWLTALADETTAAPAAEATAAPSGPAPINADGPTTNQMWIWLIIIAGVYLIVKSGFGKK